MITEKEIVIKGDLESKAKEVKETIEFCDLIDLYENNSGLIKKMTITNHETNEVFALSIDIQDDKVIINTKKEGVKNEEVD